MKNTIFTLFVILFSISLIAQAPQAFNYQGVARDLSGNPITNQNIGLRIAILQDSPTGTEVYKEIHLTQTNQFGLFELQIGDGSSVNGLFQDIDWSNGNHFIQIELDENGGSNYQLIGTSQLLSVPYALYAENGSKWNENSFGINNEYNKTNIGLSNPANNHYFKLNIRGNPTTVDSIVDLVGYYNLTSNIPIWHNSLSENEGFTFTETGVGTHMFLGKGGNVGIGTITPKGKLHIVEEVGDAVLTIESDLDDAGGEHDNPRIDFIQDGGRIGYKIGLNQDLNSINSGNDFYFQAIWEDVVEDPEPILTLSFNDAPIGELGTYIPRVGIDTAHPKSKLHISDGDVYIDNINRGVIMKSPNGNCWRYTPDNTGQLVPTAITCPN